MDASQGRAFLGLRRDPPTGEFFSEKHARDIADRLVEGVQASLGRRHWMRNRDPWSPSSLRRGIAATGIDSSASALEAAQRRSPRATFHLGSIVAIPMADRSMDAATLIETIEHLDDDILTCGIGRSAAGSPVRRDAADHDPER